MADDLDDPRIRAQVVARIAPKDAGQHHDLLRDILQRETECRRAEAGEYFETLYWCAYLLFRVGDPADVELMWEAKHIDFDTSCGFDIQFLFGAGAEQTLSYLKTHGPQDLAAELQARVAAAPEDVDDLAGWSAFRCQYFYGEDD